MGFRPEHGFSNRRCHRQGKYGKPGIIFSGIFNIPNCRLATHPKKSDINLWYYLSLFLKIHIINRVRTWQPGQHIPSQTLVV